MFPFLWNSLLRHSNNVTDTRNNISEVLPNHKTKTMHIDLLVVELLLDVFQVCHQVSNNCKTPWGWESGS